MKKLCCTLVTMALVPISFLNAEEQVRAVYRLSASAASVMGGALTNAVYWLDESGVPCSESATLDSNADYIVGHKENTVYSKNIRTGEKDIVFSGRSLTIGDDTWSKGDGVFYFSRYMDSVTLLNEGLFLRYGRMELLKHSNVEFNVFGKVTILADGADKRSFYIHPNSSLTSQTVNFHGPLIGEESSKFSIRNVTSRFLDASQYKGTVICENNGGVGMSGVSLAKVIVGENCTVFAATATDDLTLSSLSFANNTAIQVAVSKNADSDGVEHSSGATIHVTDAYAAEGQVAIRLSMDDISFDGLTNRFVVLTAPVSVGMDIDDFVLDLDMGAYPDDMRRLARLEVERGEERDSLVFTFEPVVRLTTSDNNEQTARSRATTSFADGKEGNWSDKRLPHEGAHYVVLKNGSAASYLNTMGAGTAIGGEFESRDFHGESLTIGGDCALTIFQTNSFRVGELRLLANSKVRLGQASGNVKILGQKVVAPSGEVDVLPYSGNTIEFTGNLEGAATINIPGESRTGSPSGTTFFSGDNRGFSGRFCVWQRDYNNGPPTLSVLQTLNVSATNQLGGTIPEMAWDGVWLKRMGRIHVFGNAALAAGTNRGLYVDSTSDVENTPFYGLIKINSGREFSVETQLTMNGVLRKDGPGTLTLAAPVKFGEGAVSDLPLANSNVLHVVEGDLKVRSADGIDGLEVKFGTSAGFVIDVSGCDGDFLRYGVKNVKTDTPFVLPDGATKLPLEMIYPESIPEAGMVLGVLTVRNSIASEIRIILPDMPRRIGGEIVRKIEIEDSANGWTTFALEIGIRHGTQIVIR